MRLTRTLLVALSAAAVVSLGVALPSAMAAPPGNDTIGGATAVSLGFSQSLDTIEATTDAVDTDANATCGAPSTDASVWYSFTTAADGGVVIDMSASNYPAGALVLTGSPGAFVVETCGPGTVGFNATAGTTYYVLVLDDQSDGGGNGGMLQISFNAAPPPPTIDVTVDKTGYVNPGGTATVSGTIRCTDAIFADVFTTMQQQSKKATVNGFGGFFADGSICNGTAHPWTSEVVPQSGAFQAGKAASFTSSFACGTFTCADGYTFQDIKLKAARKH